MSLKPKSSNPRPGRKMGGECVLGFPNLPSSMKEKDKDIPNPKRRSLRLNAVNCPPNNQNTEAGVDDSVAYKKNKTVESPGETKMEEKNSVHTAAFKGKEIEESSAEKHTNEKSLKEKVEYLFKSSPAWEKMIEGLVSKFMPITYGSVIDDHHDMAKYKRLYEESKTNNEALIVENDRLLSQLEETLCRLDATLGKVAAYEKMNHAASEMMDKLKDVIFYSNLTRAPEAELNLTSQAGCSTLSAPQHIGLLEI